MHLLIGKNGKAYGKKDVDPTNSQSLWYEWCWTRRIREAYGKWDDDPKNWQGLGLKGMHKGADSLLRTRMNESSDEDEMVLPSTASSLQASCTQACKSRQRSIGWDVKRKETGGTLTQEYLRIDSETPTLMPPKYWKNSNHCYLTGSRIITFEIDLVAFEDEALSSLRSRPFDNKGTKAIENAAASKFLSLVC